MASKSSVLKSRIAYEWAKLAPKMRLVSIPLKNGLKYKVRSRTMDRSVLKEVWISEIYDQHGIAVNENDIVIDIGAHIGVFSVYAANKAKNGHVHAFEPFERNYSMLSQHKEMNRLDHLAIYNAAIAKENGTETLYLSEDNNTGGHSMHMKKDSPHQVRIKTKKLIDFCKEKSIDHIDFLKLDCEGAEFDIIRSSEKILPRVSKIVMECHVHEGNTTEEMVQILERNNFKVHVQKMDTVDEIAMIYAKKLV